MNYLEPLVSIICPVYQAEQTLSNCLDSIVSQNYSNWECIIIIDGATDSSKHIAERYANMDSRFILKIQENKGRSAARNQGISLAKGIWVMFVDSDDQLLSYGINSLINVAQTYNADVVYGNYLLQTKFAEVNFSNAQQGILNLPFARIANLNIERLMSSPDGYLYDNYNCRTCWGKIYARELLEEKNIRFPENLKIGEDTAFNFQVLANSKKAAFTNKFVYLYNDMTDGTVRSFSYKDFDSIRSMSLLFEMQAKQNPELSKDIQSYVARDYLGVFSRGATFSSLRDINKVCHLANTSCTLFIKQSLPLYISLNVNFSNIYMIYNKVRIWFILHNFWRVAFLLQRLGSKLR